MTVIIIIAIITFIIFVLAGKNKSTKPTKADTNLPKKCEKELKKVIVDNSLYNIKFKELPDSSTTTYKDNSIIDVTGASYGLNPNNLKKYEAGVPYWAHHYVYSYYEINDATNEQKQFYLNFKNSFLNGVYYDLEGNTNYAFILLFNLLEEYEKHKDISELEKQIKAIGQCYSKTKSYGISFLIKKMETKGDSEGVSRLRAQDRYENQNYYNGYNYWNLGSKYKEKLCLKAEEVKLLNKLRYPGGNNFCSIEYCFLEVLKLYILTIAELKNKYIQEGTTLDKQFITVADVIAKKHFKYREGSENYKYCIESTTDEFHSIIIKYCENRVREHYGHKRKINTDTYYTTPEAKIEFDIKIISKVIEILPTLVANITPPDEATEIELYAQNTTRWKIKYEELTSNYKGNAKQFIDDMVCLGKLNKSNPSVENIFYEASKYISKSNKEASMVLYVHYIYNDLKSSSFNNKQLVKTIQKSLFRTNEQLHDFGIVVSELIKDKNLEKALQGVSHIYDVKRKKIQLNTVSIKEAQEQHSETVELLNEYLKDEYEDESNSIKTQEINSEEVKIEITQKTKTVQNSIFITDIPFTQTHTTILEMFAKSNFAVAGSDLEIFAKSKGFFKNQLIENINEICYDYLEDVLIEEEEEQYIINQNYYQKLLTK